MTKLTLVTYNKSLALFMAELETVKKILELAEKTNSQSLPDLDMWNEYHDREDYLKNAIFGLDSKWETRNWTTENWNSWNLIAQNID